MDRFLRRTIFFFLLIASAAPAAAMDPLLMFVFSLAREMIESNAAKKPALPGIELPEEASRVYPGTMVEPEHLRRLIDDSFPYLADTQRREIFESLNDALADPKNAAMRGTMIQYFVDRALTIRAARIQLSELSWTEKERLAGEFSRELPALSAEDRALLGNLLRGGLLPLPTDLNQLLLAAFDAPR